MENPKLKAINHHNKTALNEDVDNQDISSIINKSTCAIQYYKLEECLVENNRNWTKCQEFVQLLKQCSTNK